MESLRAAGVPVLDLTLSNPTDAGLPYPAAIPALLSQPDVMRYHPSPQGDFEARRAISGYYRGRGETREPEDIFLTASTSEAYSFLFKLLCDPGDEILIPSPTYPLFDALAELENVSLVRYPLRREQQNWKTDMDFLHRLVSTRSKALILVNPNNPTGHMAGKNEIAAYLDLASRHDLVLIVDEVFSDYPLGAGTFLPVVSRGPLVFTLNGLSKMLALPQMKLGWIHVAGEPGLAAEAKAQLEWIADAFLSVNTPVQLACPRLLALRTEIQGPINRRLQANLAFAKALCADASGLQAIIPDAGWYLVLSAGAAMPDEEFALDLLRKKHVHAHPGHLFGFAGQGLNQPPCPLVLSLLAPEPDFQEGLRRILAFNREAVDA